MAAQAAGVDSLMFTPFACHVCLPFMGLKDYKAWGLGLRDEGLGIRA